jgi:hypothetical protein
MTAKTTWAPTTRELTEFLEALPQHRHCVHQVVERFLAQGMSENSVGSMRAHLRWARRWIEKTRPGEWQQERTWRRTKGGVTKLDVEYWFVGPTTD